MPIEVERCVERRLADPDFLPAASDEERTRAAWAICTSLFQRGRLSMMGRKNMDLDFSPDDILIASGGQVKVIGKNEIGGYLVRFGSPDEHDMSEFKDFFTPETDFELEVGGLIPVRYEHGFDENFGKARLGFVKLARKDDVGLWVEGQLEVRSKWEQAVMELAKLGVLGWSSGTAGHLVERKHVGEGVHEIVRWPLGLDASLTPQPAEPRNTLVVPLKSYLIGAGKEKTEDDGAVKGVTGYQGNIPLADRGRAWDASAAVARLRRWAGGPDKEGMDWGKYAKVHFWVDSEDRENFGSYKLPYCDVIDGEVRAVPRAIFAVAAVLQGARGGVDIPESDKAKLRRVVDRWYARMRDEFDDDGIVPPWRKSLYGDEGDGEGGGNGVEKPVIIGDAEVLAEMRKIAVELGIIEKTRPGGSEK